MPHVLALDQGTTSSRAIIFNRDGEIVATAQKEFEQIFPRPGWVEHDPNEIWSSQISVASEVLSRASIESRELAALGITNQRETTVLWERATGKPVHNAIVWQDRRTAGMCDRLRASGHFKLFQERTGLVLDAYFAGTKLAWLLEHVEGARARAEAGELCFGTVDSWLVYKLTHGKLHLTDATNACRTLLFNIHTGDWDDDILSLLNIPRAVLPTVRASSEVYGETAVDAFASPVPIAGIAGDQHAALYGQVCTKPGMVKNTYGTGCFMLQNTGTEPTPSTNNLLSTVAWRIGNRTEYALEGSIFIAGAVVQWLRDGLKLIRSASEIESLARTVDDNGGMYLVPAFAGLGAPHWDQYARGAMVGLTRGITAGHFARAALEGIALQCADVLDAIESDSGLKCEELRVDGGAAANDLLLQIQSDIMGVRIVRPKNLESTALGAAYLAGLATGFWENENDLASHYKVDRAFEPQLSRDDAQHMRAQWARAIERAKGWELPDNAQ